MALFNTWTLAKARFLRRLAVGKKTTRPTITKPSAHVETPLSKVGHKRKNVDLWQDNTKLDVDIKKRAKTEKAVDAL